jgi:hypothetical protein
MGQRLNIEIVENGVCLANAYYHWSAYTSSAFELAKQIIEAIPTVKEEIPVMKAIRLLEVTGAKLMSEEIDFAKKLLLGDFEKATDRNDGLISISEKGIAETRQWQEGAVYIYLDEKRMKFDVLVKTDIFKYIKDEEKYNDRKVEFQDIPTYNIDFSDIKFDGLIALEYFLTAHKDESFRTVLDRWNVIEFIE